MKPRKVKPQEGIEQSQLPILFFDGYCNLCNRTVDFLLRHTKDGTVYFSSLQSETAETLVLPIHEEEPLPDSIILYQEGKLYFESDAAMKLIPFMLPPWKALYIFYVFPRFIRQAVYRHIARNRNRWFGKRDTCRLPTSREAARFLV